MEDGEVGLLRQARAAVATFDDCGSGRINFPEFLIMLTRKPWREMLPDHVPWAVDMENSPEPFRSKLT